MINKEVVRRRLIKLDDYLGILRRLRRYSWDEFISDPEHYGSVERYLQLAIEAINDIGNHIIADEDLGTVEAYRDIPGILHEHGIIQEDFVEKWIRMIGFRNTLVHDYVDIDRKIVFQVLRNNLEDMDDVRKIFANYL